jgi:hypothetical protein
VSIDASCAAFCCATPQLSAAACVLASYWFTQLQFKRTLLELS